MTCDSNFTAEISLATAHWTFHAMPMSCSRSQTPEAQAGNQARVTRHNEWALRDSNPRPQPCETPSSPLSVTSEFKETQVRYTFARP